MLAHGVFVEEGIYVSVMTLVQALLFYFFCLRLVCRCLYVCTYVPAKQVWSNMLSQALLHLSRIGSVGTMSNCQMDLLSLFGLTNVIVHVRTP